MRFLTIKKKIICDNNNNELISLKVRKKNEELDYV